MATNPPPAPALQPSASYTRTPLFGGALTADLPPGYLDASTIRPVPDTQEVFIGATAATSILFDLTERAAPPAHPTATSDAAALRVHFEDYVQTGTRADKEDEDEGKVVKETGGFFGERSWPRGDLVGVVKGDGGLTLVFLTLLRLAAVGTDVLIIVNAPFGEKEVVDGEALLRTDWVEELELMRERVVSSFMVVDWGLFGEGGEGKI